MTIPKVVPSNGKLFPGNESRHLRILSSFNLKKNRQLKEIDSLISFFFLHRYLCYRNGFFSPIFVT
jgi:hypothetical protein